MATKYDAATEKLVLFLGASLRSVKLPSAATGSTPSSAEFKLPCLMAKLEAQPQD